MDNKQNSFLDAIAMVSFIIGVLNYNENVDQSTMDNAVKSAVEDIHNHLKKQDDKINAIMAKLGIKEQDYEIN